jgi:hypothetical protein
MINRMQFVQDFSQKVVGGVETGVLIIENTSFPWLLAGESLLFSILKPRP